MIGHSRLGELTKIGKGGQGVVYLAPNLRTDFAPSMVYKKYKPLTLAEIDFDALSAMPRLLTDVLQSPDARRLISLAAWPCAIVETDRQPTGFVMPAIPDKFYIAVKTVKGTERAVAEFQHLLNDAEFLTARGLALTDTCRLQVLREVASALAFLHRYNICVGDVSPRNLLFSLPPAAAIYLVDCDTMRVSGTSALPQLETPGWEAPPGEELATVYSDTYKLGLLALRLLVGDQDSRDVSQLSAEAPPFLRRIISDSLDANPARRPLPSAWTSILDGLIKDWNHSASIFGIGSAKTVQPDGEHIVSLRSRPAVTSGSPAANRSPAQPMNKTAKAATSSSSTPKPNEVKNSELTIYFIGVGLAGVVLMLVVILANVISR